MPVEGNPGGPGGGSRKPNRKVINNQLATRLQGYKATRLTRLTEATRLRGLQDTEATWLLVINNMLLSLVAPQGGRRISFNVRIS